MCIEYGAYTDFSISPFFLIYDLLFILPSGASRNHTPAFAGVENRKLKIPKVLNPQAHLTDSSNSVAGILPAVRGRDALDTKLQWRPSSHNNGGKAKTSFALMAGAERLVGWAGVSYRIRRHYKGISQRNR
jgi:hypothetical protein